jgi:TRAP transporter 4TM/12TM fusion protein
VPGRLAELIQATGARQSAARLLALGLALFHLYLGLFGTLEAFRLRTIHLGVVLLLVFLWPTGAGSRRRAVLDAVAIALLLPSIGYLLVNYEELITRFPFVTPLTPAQMVLGLLLIGLILDGARRVTGPVLPVTALVFIAYFFLGPYLGSIFRHSGYTLEMFVDVQYLTAEGTFGIPLGASANYIVLFVLFGALLERSGLGRLLMDLALGLAGRRPGGPAMVAVISSALFGTISGSPTSNVLTTGAMTIPLMRKAGYPATFAAGVEAAASTGGMFMPPVMGIVAFIMSDYTGIPYIQIALHALIPAILYYLCVGVQVQLKALKSGLRGLDPADVPDWRRSLAERWHLTLPIGLLLGLMIFGGYTPMLAVSYSIVALLVVAQLRPVSRFTLPRLLEALIYGAQSSLLVATATALAGMMAGIIAITGLGLRLNTSLFDLAGGMLLPALLVTAAASLVLGLGLPASASYIIQAATIAPALVNILKAEGLGEHAVIAGHLFLMYFATLAVLTPPDAMAAFAAAGLARCDPMATAFQASKLAIVAYVVPFMFVFGPGLLLVGGPLQILAAIPTAVVGIIVLGIALEGYWGGHLTVVERGLLLAASLTLVNPGLVTDAMGVGVILIVFLLRRRRAPGPAAVAAVASAASPGRPDGRTGDQS